MVLLLSKNEKDQQNRMSDELEMNPWYKWSCLK